MIIIPDTHIRVLTDHAVGGWPQHWVAVKQVGQVDVGLADPQLDLEGVEGQVLFVPARLPVTPHRHVAGVVLCK